MLQLQAYRFELMPNGEQKRKMRQFAGSARYVFNRALAIQQEEREKTGRKRSGYAALCKMLTAWRHFESLKKLRLGKIQPGEVVEAPKFKKKHRTPASFRYPDPKEFKIEQGNNRVFLPKVGWVRYRNSRVMEGTPSNVTVSCDGSKWYASIQTEREVEMPVHESSSIVGIDLGVVRFATLSNGKVIQPCNPLEEAGSAETLPAHDGTPSEVQQ